MDPATTRAAAVVQLLTVIEAAERLKITRKHLYELIDEGRITPINVGKRASRKPTYRITSSEIDGFIRGLGRIAAVA
jgi:excisionase family DNA binding protein